MLTAIRTCELVLARSRPVADRERRPHRPLGVVLVRDRRAEERHHRVADELLDRSAETLELGAQMRVVRREHARTSSGSSRSARAVNPTRSANSAVTTLRSSRRGAAGCRGAAQALQNRARPPGSLAHKPHKPPSKKHGAAAAAS